MYAQALRYAILLVAAKLVEMQHLFALSVFLMVATCTSAFLRGPSVLKPFCYSTSYQRFSPALTALSGISGTPLENVVRLRGTVDSGYGRGGKKLGFPTANLPSSLFQTALDKIPTGVYFGWALIEGTGSSLPHKAAVNVGYSPTFEGKENKEKIVEAHLILGDEDPPLADFYGKVMRLSLLSFLRPEQKFNSFLELIQAITTDIANAKESLDREPYVSFRMDGFLTEASVTWIGRNGGDESASWEFEPSAIARTKIKGLAE